MTVLQWLEQAKADGHEWADAAIQNTLNDDPFTGNSECNSLSSALVKGFFWGLTKQGAKYWSEIRSKISNQQK